MSIVKTTLIRLGFSPREDNHFFRIPASWRGGDNPTSVSVHSKTGRWVDFPTSEFGSFDKLLEKILGRPLKPRELERYETIASKLEVDDFEKLEEVNIYDKGILDTMLPLYDFYLNRGIAKETLQEFQAGLCQGGKLRNRICFPIYDYDKNIIGFTGRWCFENVPDQVPKHKHIGNKANFLWPVHLNESIHRESREIILVESPGCILAQWNAGVKTGLCLFGTSVSSKIISYLTSVCPKRIIIATNNEPDNDSIGFKAAVKIKKKLLKFFDEESILIRLPPKKDFGDMSKSEIQKYDDGLKERKEKG